MKILFNLICLLTIITSSTVFADPYGDDLFDLRIFNGLFKKSNDLSYIITLPANEYYYSLIDDQWKLVEDRVIEGKIKSSQVSTIRIYGSYDPVKGDRPKLGKARLTVIDPDNARVVWQGNFYYDRPSNQITATAEIDNKKNYTSRLDITGGQYAADVDIWISDKYSIK